MLEQASDELKESICQSFNTSVNQVKQDVQVLREWLSNQPHLPQGASDIMLMSFLIACKNKMERTKEKIDNYYTVRSEMPKLFANRDPLDPKVQLSADAIHLYTLPKLTPDGCRVVISSFTEKDATNYDTWAFFKRMIATEDIKLHKESYVRGVYLIFDDINLTMGHTLKITPSLCREVMYCAQDVLPMIIKGVMFINAPSYLDLVLKILRPFMKAKIFDRVHVHTTGAEALEEYFPRSMLPRDYGGEEDTSENLSAAWIKALEENRDWLMNEGSATTNESKRSTAQVSKKSKKIGELEGTFRTLCVD